MSEISDIYMSFGNNVPKDTPPKETDFQKVKATNNWGRDEELAGKSLTKGEHLQFQLKDGTLYDTEIHEDSHGYTIRDMGVPYETSDTAYYILIDWHGESARLYIAGLLARRKW